MAWTQWAHIPQNCLSTQSNSIRFDLLGFDLHSLHHYSLASHELYMFSKVHNRLVGSSCNDKLQNFIYFKKITGVKISLTQKSKISKNKVSLNDGEKKMLTVHLKEAWSKIKCRQRKQKLQHQVKYNHRFITSH